MTKSFVGLDIVKEDARRNGVDQMLMDLAAMNANGSGVQLTAEAEAFVIECITNRPTYRAA